MKLDRRKFLTGIVAVGSVTLLPSFPEHVASTVPVFDLAGGHIKLRNWSGGIIWIDTVNGIPGTVNFMNGTVAHPVSNIADAKILSRSLDLPWRFV